MRLLKAFRSLRPRDHVVFGAILLVSAAAAWWFADTQRTAEAQIFLRVTMHGNTNTAVQVFYDVGHGVTEEQSVVLPIRDYESYSEYPFLLPFKNVFYLRLDPFPCPGNGAIRAIRFEDGHGHVLRDLPLTDVVAAAQIARMELRDDELLFETTPDASDAQFQIRLEEPFRIDRGAIDRAFYCRFAAALVIFTGVLLTLVLTRKRMTSAVLACYGFFAGLFDALVARLAPILARGKEPGEARRETQVKLADLFVFLIPVALFLAWNWHMSARTTDSRMFFARHVADPLGFSARNYYIRCGALMKNVLMIEQIKPGGVIDAAGFRNGDIFVDYTTSDFYEFANSSVGTTVTVHVVDGGDGPPLKHRPYHSIPVYIPAPVESDEPGNP